MNGTKNWIIFALGPMLLAACGGGQPIGSNPSPSTSSAAQTATDKSAQRFQLEGEVLSVDQVRGAAVVNHKAIEGFMAAMTMSFPVPEKADLNKIKPGDHIVASLYFSPADNRYWIADIKVPKQ